MNKTAMTFLCLLVLCMMSSCKLLPHDGSANIAKKQGTRHGKPQMVVTQINTKIYRDRHLAIPDNAIKQIGFVPDTATNYKIESSLEKNIKIKGEKVPFIKLSKELKKLTINYIVDSNKDHKRHFRILIAQDTGFIPFKVNGQNVNFYDFEMPGASSAKIPIKLSLNHVQKMTDLYIILIDKNQRNFYTDPISTTRILVSNGISPLDNKLGVKRSDFTKKNLKYKKTYSNKWGSPNIALLDSKMNKVKVGETKKAKFIRIDQVPKDIVERILLFSPESVMNG